LTAAGFPLAVNAVNHPSFAIIVETAVIFIDCFS